MSFINTALRGTSLGVLAFLSMPAFANHGGAPKSTASEAPVPESPMPEAIARDSIIVTAAGRTAHARAEIRKTPGGVDVVPETMFKDRFAVSLRDTLAFSPGVYAQPRFGQEVRLSIRGSGISRGYHMRGLTLLQDGIPINLADDNGDFQELDPAFLERIEVYRGGNALRFGGSTLGGAINGVTRTGRSAPGLALDLAGGSFDTFRAQAAAGFVSGRGDAYIAIGGDQSDGDRQHARRKALRFSGNAGLALSETVETRFYANAQTIRQRLPGALTMDDARNRPRKGNFAGDQQRNIDSLRLQNRTTAQLGDVRVEGGAFLNLKQLDHPIFEVVDQTSTDWGFFGRMAWQGGPVGLTLGATARFGEVDSRRFVNVGGDSGALRFSAEQKARTVNAYAEGRFAVTPQLSLIAGGIYSHGVRRQQQFVAAPPMPAPMTAPGIPTPALGRVSFDNFSPKFGLLWEPREEVQFYANYNRSVELPGFVELAQIASFVPLRPQRAWTIEAGSRGTIGAAHWDVSLYRADLKGEMLQYSVSADIPASTFNAGRTRHQGVEATLGLDMGRWLRLQQTYSYNDFRFRRDVQFGNNRLPVVPRHVYRAELRIGMELMHLTPNIEWVPRGPWADYVNETRVKGYATFGLTAAMFIRPGLSAFVDARNLTGRKAIGDISAAIRATPASAIYYPVERRAVYVGLKGRF